MDPKAGTSAETKTGATTGTDRVLRHVLDAITPGSDAHAEGARLRVASAGTPVLERLAAALGAAQHTTRVRTARRMIVVVAGDHGIGDPGITLGPAHPTAIAAHAIADGSAALFILAPAAGALANYSAPRTVTVSWVAARFDSAALRGGRGLLANASLPVALALDGARVATLPAPGGAPGPQTFELDVGALDARFPHVLTVTALPGADAGAHLTRWPLSFDAVDADAAGGVPLAEPVPAAATAWIWLPETQAQ